MTSTVSISIANALRRWTLFACLAGGLMALGGCATGPSANPRDPLEPFNRNMMQFNEGVDSIVLRPVATLYREKVPALARTGVSNFFANMGDAWSFVNSALQFKIHNAVDNLMRFQLNTVFGMAGIFDIASEANIDRHKEDFGQTLGHWGMPPGPYLVLPLLGPSTVRDTLALPIDRRGDPLGSVDPGSAQGALYLLRAVDIRSNLLRASSVLDEAALDKYSFTRDAHLQRRRAEIFESTYPDGGDDGREPTADGEPASKPQSPAPVPAQ
jgi:phospholipid-binding lipoprotein MlaA